MGRSIVISYTRFVVNVLPRDLDSPEGSLWNLLESPSLSNLSSARTSINQLLLFPECPECPECPVTLVLRVHALRVGIDDNAIRNKAHKQAAKRAFLLAPFSRPACCHAGDTRAVQPTTALYGAHKAIKTSVQMYTLRMLCNTLCTSALSHLSNVLAG